MKIIYSRGFPYGAPLVMLRGGGTRNPSVKAFLREQRFTWNGQSHAWEHYLNRPELEDVLTELRDVHGCVILAKTDIDPGYVLEAFQERQEA